MTEYKDDYRRSGCGCDPAASRMNRTPYGHKHPGTHTGYRNNRTTYPRTGSTCGCNTRDGDAHGGKGGECCALMQKLRTLEFAIVDTALYLNAYPDSDCALAYYHKLLEERDCLRKTINEQCGPLNIYENTDKDGWRWTDGPWPWQIDAN